MTSQKRKNTFLYVITIITVCLLLLLLSRRVNHLPGFARRGHSRVLRQEEIRPILKKITGRELPNELENLQAVCYSYAGIDEVYVSFKIDQNGCLFIVDEFDGPDVKKEEFPKKENNVFQWDIAGFSVGCEFQKKHDTILFDNNLFQQIQHDALEQLDTGRFPDNSVTGYYLEFDDSSKRIFYRVLVFTDKNIVYIVAEKSEEGSNGGR